GRDLSTVPDPADGARPGVVRPLARPGATQVDAAPDPRAASRRPVADRSARSARGDRTAGRRVQRAAGEAVTEPGRPEAVHRRCGAPDEDAACGPAHAGRAGDARHRSEAIAAQP